MLAAIEPPFRTPGQAARIRFPGNPVATPLSASPGTIAGIGNRKRIFRASAVSASTAKSADEAARAHGRLKKIRDEATVVLDAFRLMMVRTATEKRRPFDPLAPNEETIAANEFARRPAEGLRSRSSKRSRAGEGPCGRQCRSRERAFADPQRR